MKNSDVLDAIKNLEKAKKAADDALKPYGFRLCNVDNVTIKPEYGYLYVNCKLVFVTK